MGCDIHAIYEVRKPIYDGSDYCIWINAGNPRLRRNYELFSVLANVRNSGHIPCIGCDRLRGIDFKEAYGICSDEFRALTLYWNGDAHSHSFATLKEMKNFSDIPMGVDCWDRLLSEMETIKKLYSIDVDEKIRIACFFDN